YRQACPGGGAWGVARWCGQGRGQCRECEGATPGTARLKAAYRASRCETGRERAAPGPPLERGAGGGCHHRRLDTALVSDTLWNESDTQGNHALSSSSVCFVEVQPEAGQRRPLPDLLRDDLSIIASNEYVHASVTECRASASYREGRGQTEGEDQEEEIAGEDKRWRSPHTRVASQTADRTPSRQPEQSRDSGGGGEPTFKSVSVVRAAGCLTRGRAAVLEQQQQQQQRRQQPLGAGQPPLGTLRRRRKAAVQPLGPSAQTLLTMKIQKTSLPAADHAPPGAACLPPSSASPLLPPPPPLPLHAPSQ
ncbi:unnamed protein product, partial [Gadus morhua 'NCC']